MVCIILAMEAMSLCHDDDVMASIPGGNHPDEVRCSRDESLEPERSERCDGDGRRTGANPSGKISLIQI